jgi:hypothetical protein
MQAVERMADLAVSTPDDAWVNSLDWEILLTADDRTMIMDKVRTDLVPLLDDLFGVAERERHDDPIDNALFRYEKEFSKAGDYDTASEFDSARDFYNQLPYREDDEEEYDYQGRSALTRSGLAPEPDAGRSIFDDIDED